MIETPPPAYVKAYWDDVADLLKSVHHAPKSEIAPAIAEFRDHMKPAGQTIYNDDPAEIAETIVAHGLIPSLPAVGAKLQLTFTFTDRKKVAANVIGAAVSADALVAALDRMERAFGGEGFEVGTPEVLPGMVLLALTPVQALGAVERLAKVAAELDKATRQLTKADKELKGETARRAKSGERVTASVMCQAA